MHKSKIFQAKILPNLNGGLFYARRAFICLMGTLCTLFGGARDANAAVSTTVASPVYQNAYWFSDFMDTYSGTALYDYYGYAIGTSCSRTDGNGVYDAAIHVSGASITNSGCIAKLQALGLCATNNDYVMNRCGVDWANGYGKPLTCANGGGEGNQIPTLSAGCTLTVDGDMAGMGGGEYNFTMEEEGCGDNWYAFVSEDGGEYSSALCYLDYTYNGGYCDFYTSNYSCSDATNGYMGGGGYRVYYGSGITFTCAGAECSQAFQDYFNCNYYNGSDRPSYCTNGTNYMTGFCRYTAGYGWEVIIEGTGAALIDEFCEGGNVAWRYGCRLTGCTTTSDGWYTNPNAQYYDITANPGSGACLPCSGLYGTTTSIPAVDGFSGFSGYLGYYVVGGLTATSYGPTGCRAMPSGTVSGSDEAGNFTVSGNEACYWTE